MHKLQQVQAALEMFARRLYDNMIDFAVQEALRKLQITMRGYVGDAV